MTAKRAIQLLVVLLIVGQAVRPARTNPAIDPQKTLLATGHVTPRVNALFARACQDCHSSETRWPWYSNVAPVSWLLVDHVNDGRKELSFSNWADYDAPRLAKKLEEICEQVREGEMPMEVYVVMHPDAKLTAEERQAICAWTAAERARLGVPGDREENEEGR